MPEGQQRYQKETPTQVFSLKFAKFLRTPILKDICEQILPDLEKVFDRSTDQK